MDDFATQFARLETKPEQVAFVAGATLVYRDLMDSIAKAFEAGGLTKVFMDMSEQYKQLCGLIAVEGVVE